VTSSMCGLVGPAPLDNSRAAATTTRMRIRVATCILTPNRDYMTAVVKTGHDSASSPLATHPSNLRACAPYVGVPSASEGMGYRSWQGPASSHAGCLARSHASPRLTADGGLALRRPVLPVGSAAARAQVSLELVDTLPG
jgi:hypothetical protein